MSQNLLLTKVTSKFGTSLFGVAKVIADRYGGINMEDGDVADIVIFPRNKCFTDKSQAEARLKELQNEN